MHFRSTCLSGCQPQRLCLPCFALRRCLCLYRRHKYTKSLPHSMLARGQGVLWLKPDCACPTQRHKKNRLQLRILRTRGKCRNVHTCLCSICKGGLFGGTVSVWFSPLLEGLFHRCRLLIKSASSSQSVMTHLTVAQEERFSSSSSSLSSKSCQFWVRAVIIL